ncbi:hypothetical protein HYFRA_00004221 [Hymenoscyphus fraxineus]|uniref:Uncharacterized protein n=1 Tax=Hymenoscyphus fraxineus TaxID=746836 RepID=A0A9N9KMV6_9HELO|nr:hypothetical protein HYFRA_00004221 [Hymenoscyphus fraxineus]
MAGSRKPPPIPESPTAERLECAINRLRKCMEVDLERRISYAKTRADERRRASLNFVPSHRPRIASPLTKSVVSSQMKSVGDDTYDATNNDSIIVRPPETPRYPAGQSRRGGDEDENSSDNDSVIVKPSSARKELLLAQHDSVQSLSNQVAGNLEKRKELFMSDLRLLEQRCRGLAQESELEFGDGASWLEEVSAKFRRMSYKATGEMKDQLDDLK